MKKFKLVIVGGGSTYTPGIVKSLLAKKEEFKIDELRLYDINEERQNKVGVIVKKVVEMFDPEVKLIFTTKPEEAFKDADFVFAQMRVGKYEMREQDEKILLDSKLLKSSSYCSKSYVQAKTKCKDLKYM